MRAIALSRRVTGEADTWLVAIALVGIAVAGPVLSGFAQAASPQSGPPHAVAQAGPAQKVTAKPADWAGDPVAARANRSALHEQFPAVFAPVADRPGLPRVLLIGDSISIYYTPFVRDLLRDEANVHRVPDNGGSTTLGVALLDEWVGDSRWDVIHFNFGLHDVTVIDGRPRNTPAAYEANLRRIVARLKRTGARLVFATTTPVPGETTNPTRRAADAEALDRVARTVMTELGVPLDDLYAFVRPRLAELQTPANVHFREEGSRELGQQVADAIRRALVSRSATPQAGG